MRSKQILKIAVDAAMSFILLLLMAYELIGQATHEWLGIGMFALFILHHILNRGWYRSLVKGSYTVLRFIQNAVVILLLISMCGAKVSGAILSRHALSFLPINGGWPFARNLHMLSVYWGFALMGLHLGLHWNMIIGMAGKFASKPSTVCKYLLRFIAFLIAGYGVYAFIKRDIISYMILKNQFAFFNFEEPLIWFLLDYIACMGTVVCIGYFMQTALRRIRRRSRGDK